MNYTLLLNFTVVEHASSQHIIKVTSYKFCIRKLPIRTLLEGDGWWVDEPRFWSFAWPIAAWHIMYRKPTHIPTGIWTNCQNTILNRSQQYLRRCWTGRKDLETAVSRCRVSISRKCCRTTNCYSIADVRWVVTPRISGCRVGRHALSSRFIGPHWRAANAKRREDYLQTYDENQTVSETSERRQQSAVVMWGALRPFHLWQT